MSQHSTLIVELILGAGGEKKYQYKYLYLPRNPQISAALFGLRYTGADGQGGGQAEIHSKSRLASAIEEK